MRKNKISFLLNSAELNLLKGILYLEPSLVEGVENAKPEAGRYRVEFSDEELAESLEALSYSMDYTSVDRKTEQLHALYDKIKNYLILSQDLGRLDYK